MTRQKIPRAETFAPFALQHENAQGLASAGDDDAVPGRLQNFPGVSGTSLRDFGLGDFEQLRLWFSGQKRIGAGPGDQSSNPRSEEHTSELQSQSNLVCRL